MLLFSQLPDGIKEVAEFFHKPMPVGIFLFKNLLFFVTIIDYRNYKNTSLYAYQSDAKLCN